MTAQTMAGTCADIDDLHRQIAALTADNGRLRGQQHDLVRAREAACADACMLRDELKAANNKNARLGAENDRLRGERDTARACSPQRGW